MSSPKLLTVPEVADRLRCHQETVRKMLRRGEITGIKMPSANRGGTWKVRESSLDRFMSLNERAA